MEALSYSLLHSEASVWMLKPVQHDGETMSNRR